MTDTISATLSHNYTTFLSLVEI